MSDWFLFLALVFAGLATHCIVYFIAAKRGWDAGFDEAMKYKPPR